MALTRNSKYEGVFAAAAHHLIAARHYHEAVLVCTACRQLLGYRIPKRSVRRQLDVVRELCCCLFSGYTRSGPVPASELQSLRMALEDLDNKYQQELNKLKVHYETIYDYIDAITKRPGLYLGRPSLELLLLALQPSLIPHRKLLREKPSFHGFKKWVDRRYAHLQGGGSGWWRILNEASGGDEERAFELFRKELKAYRKSEG